MRLPALASLLVSTAIRTAVAALTVGVSGCGVLDGGRVDSVALEQTPGGPRLGVTVVGNPTDSRIPPLREAVDYWNRELVRLGRRVQLDTPTVRADSIPDNLLRGASGEATMGGGTSTNRLLTTVERLPAGIVIALSQTDLISFSVRWRAKSHGVVGVRRADIPPLSMPNTVRNVIAHEIGHVLGLNHNRDSTTLMCGRPAPCRPAAFTSETPRFFPLTAADDDRLRRRWP